MDIDLEGLYEEDFYDTPSNLIRAPHPGADTQHRSAPTLRTTPKNTDDLYTHSSAPNLENDYNQSKIHDNVTILSNVTVSKPESPVKNDNDDLYFDQDIYMNTTFNAEERLSRHNSIKTIPSVLNSRKSSLSKPENISTNMNGFTEIYYMAPLDGVSLENDPSQENGLDSPGYYDAPSKIDYSVLAASLSPAILADRPTTLKKEGDSHSIDSECFYEGIDDTPVDSFYNMVTIKSDDNFYKGVEPCDEAYYDGLEENYNDLYEGIDSPNGVFFKDNKNRGASIIQGDSTLFAQRDSPYIPPKPPPVPYRKPFTPLPEIRPPQTPLPSPPPTRHLSLSTRPTLLPRPLSKSVDVNMHNCVNNADQHLLSESDDGFYDGVDMDDDDECEIDDQDDDLVFHKMRRSYSIRQSVRRTRQRTASKLEQFKESISMSLKERKNEWRDCRARSEIKSVLKETKLKASGIVTGTELLYSSGKAVLQRRSQKRSKRSCSLGKYNTSATLIKENKQDRTEFEDTVNFHSLPDIEISYNAESSHYLDIENSSGDTRSSMASSCSRGTTCTGTAVRLPTSNVKIDEEYTKMGTTAYGDSTIETILSSSAEMGSEINKPRSSSFAETSLSTNLPERLKVLQQILDHEYRYIMSLKDTMKVYAAPLQQSNNQKFLIEPTRAQEIFFRIPEITVHHEFFYEQLRRRSMSWSTIHQSIGDILLQLFHKPALFGAYASYIDNFSHALDIVQETRSARPAFSKFLDKLRSKTNQLSLEDLIYLPVDHIPVYLELLKELIKHTPQEHPDYTYLYMAKDEVERLIEKLKERRAQAEKSFSVQQLEKKISGLPTSLVVPQRYIVNTEKIREMDIMTDCSGDRTLVVMSDLILCLKPLTRSSNSLLTSSQPAEYQYLWDCLITDLKIINLDKHNTEQPTEDATLDTTQSLKDDLEILEQIDTLRKQLSGSYSSLRLDKLHELKEKIKKEIAERQFSEECRRGRLLDVVRPVNSPCTDTQFHRYLFSTPSKCSLWIEGFLARQELLHHTKDLDWCQIGDDQTVNPERLGTLLPVIKHMTPIGLTTPTEISVECAVANADFTCPLTQDILYRIMSSGEDGEKYANVGGGEEIPLLPPGPAPEQDTPLYDEELTLPHHSSPLARAAPPRPAPPRPAQAVPNSAIVVPPVPGNHVLNGTHRLFTQTSTSSSTSQTLGVSQSVPKRLSILEIMQSIPKEFSLDDKTPSDENMYETPYEISLLRAQKRKLMRSLSIDENFIFSSLTDLTQSAAEDVSRDSPDSGHVTPSDQSGPTDIFNNFEQSEVKKTDEQTDELTDITPTADEHPMLGFLPDESFSMELTESREFGNPHQLQDSLAPTIHSINSGSESLLVDKYGHVYTDKIAGIISGPASRDSTVAPESLLPTFEEDLKVVSLLELDSEDEDDTPKYDSQMHLNLGYNNHATSSLDTTLSQPSTQVSSQTTPQYSSNTSHDSSRSDSLRSNSSQQALPHIIADNSEIITPLPEPPNSIYENMSATTKKLRTKVIRRESSKRSLTRKPSAVSARSNVSDEWQEPDCYENLDEEPGQFELKSTDVFLCGHGKDGAGEVVVLRLTEPTPHVVLNIALEGRQVLCCQMVPGKINTLWIGTQDARLLVYQMSNPSSTLLEHELQGGPVTCISYIGDCVFVGSSDGYVHVFTRDLSVNEWCDNPPLTKKLGNSSICAMLPIGGCMWCSCGCQIFVISQKNVTVEHLFSTHNNTSAQVYKMVNCGSGVWLAIRNSPVIRLFHAKTGEHLQDYDISTLVHHLFTGSQSTARRRRSDNVRVTALLASASTAALWIGTSAGVIVVVPIVAPPVAPKVCGPPFLSYMGHYDGVRFLIQAQSRIQKILSESTEDEIVYEEITSQVVISGGKGMEDYRDLSTGANNTGSDIQNKSYIIIWHYPTTDDPAHSTVEQTYS